MIYLFVRLLETYMIFFSLTEKFSQIPVVGKVESAFFKVPSVWPSSHQYISTF